MTKPANSVSFLHTKNKPTQKRNKQLTKLNAKTVEDLSETMSSLILLTKEQKLTLPAFLAPDEKGNDQINTTPCDLAAAMPHINHLYEYVKELPKPKVVFGPFNDPKEMHVADVLVKRMILGRDVNEVFNYYGQEYCKPIFDKINEQWVPDLTIEEYKHEEDNDIHSYYNQSRGFQLDMILNNIKVEGFEEEALMPFGKLESNKVCIHPETRDLYYISSSNGWMKFFKDYVILSHPPKVVSKNERGTLHDPEKPAVQFNGDGSCDLHFIRGVFLTKPQFDGEFTYDMIEKETNAEVKRCLIERFGAEKFVQEAGMELISTDDWGKLWKKAVPGDEDVWIVEVVNSTPEPDGEYKIYYLRVAPNVYGEEKPSARAAIASTWRHEKTGELVFKTPEDYVLEMES